MPLGARLTSWPTQGQTTSSNRILFVDDCIDIREAVPKVLERSGYRVDIAEDGEAGWEALQGTRYDLLITDHKMPKLTGVELVRKLRFARMELPVILASAALPMEALGRNPLLQIAAVLPKPFTVAELLETVKAVLGAAVGCVRTGSQGMSILST
jgi:DNA-binding response OmpR family regulator